MSIRSMNSTESAHTYALAPICIVGGGLAGLLLARKLSEAGRKVIVLESGNEAASEEADRLNELDDPASRYTRATTGRRRGLGGTSSLWGGRMIRISPRDTFPRPHVPEGAWDLPATELYTYEQEIEDLFRVASGSHDELEDEAGPIAPEFPTDWMSLVPRWAKCPRFKNCNIATLLKDKLRRSPNIDIWLDATVCDFELDRQSGRLAAVRARNFSGRELLVKADRFVIAAGTIETTRLLLMLQQRSGYRAFSRCKVLGRYFQDHLKAHIATIDRRDPKTTNRLFGYRFVNGTRRDLHLELGHGVQVRDEVGSAFAYIAMDLEDSPLSHVKQIAHSIQRGEMDFKATARLSGNVGLIARAAAWRLVRKQLFVPADIALRLMVCIEQLPDWNNRLVLSDKLDALGVPMVHCDWKPTDKDERTFRSTINAITDYWEYAGFNKICPLEWVSPVHPGSGYVTHLAEACAHPSGSTRMGTDPATSVVGPDLHCHDVPNVAVASASVFPSAGSANPTLTIMKLALWLADSFLREPSRQMRPHAINES